MCTSRDVAAVVLLANRRRDKACLRSVCVLFAICTSAASPKHQPPFHRQTWPRESAHPRCKRSPKNSCWGGNHRCMPGTKRGAMKDDGIGMGTVCYWDRRALLNPQILLQSLEGCLELTRISMESSIAIAAL